MTSVRDHHAKKYGAREDAVNPAENDPFSPGPEPPTEEVLKSFYVEGQINRGAFLMRNAIIAAVLFLIVGFAVVASVLMR